ncbi:hypothetical protein BDV19DRAFT_382853 [Aspergillus venezuelensis]
MYLLRCVYSNEFMAGVSPPLQDQRLKQIQTMGGKCTALTPDGPLHITADCIDPAYRTPIITSATDKTFPVPHHEVSGYFSNTSIDFNLYFPLKAKQSWSSRFFQLVYPLQNSTAEDEAIAFGIDSGAYTLRVAGRVGYRAEAAAAKFSRRVACQYYYGDKDMCSEHIYGYVYGGSGGSLQTIGAIENTVGVWDGGLALIQAIPVSNPNDFTISALATLVLENKAQLVGDALRPGGSGNPFIGLESYERFVLEEVTALGIPLFSWETLSGETRAESYEVMRTLVIATIKGVDPGYMDDFWNREGYTGAEESELGRFFRESLVEYNDTVQSVQLGNDGVPVGITLGKVPQGSSIGLEFTILDEDYGYELGSFTGTFDETDKTVFIYSDNNETVLASLFEGAQLRIDNRWYLAAHTYHRHQVPPLEDGYYAYDYLRDKNGQPLYPQRDIFIAPTNSIGASGGGTHTGNIKAKLMVMDNLLDSDAFPWHADWYKRQVQAALGDRRFENQYRLYFNENADHYMGPVAKSSQTRIVDFTGLYEQLLRDLSGWVEQGLEPALQTQYKVKNGQLTVPESASHRGGIQPVVVLTVDAASRTDIDAGDSVELRVNAEVPSSAGEIVAVEWDFYGTGDFVAGTLSEPCKKLNTIVKHVYNATGTYFPAVRVASHRDGDMDTAFARALNLGRARVVVHRAL